MYAVACGSMKFCSIECCRHHGYEPERMLMHFEYDDGHSCEHCEMPIDANINEEV